MLFYSVPSVLRRLEHLVKTSYQVKLSRKRTFHHFMSTGATEKSYDELIVTHIACKLNSTYLASTVILFLTIIIAIMYS